MPETNSDTPVAFVLQRILRRDDVNDDSFERRMVSDVFPSVNTNDEGAPPDRHLLLRNGAPNEYVWMSYLEYAVHQTPVPLWLSDRVQKMEKDVPEKLETLGTRTSFEFYYDVGAWRRRIGI
jgi:hypothetical protein